MTKNPAQIRLPVIRSWLTHDALIVDSFAGGGGASTGIELALGRGPDIAVNHDPEAIVAFADGAVGCAHGERWPNHERGHP